jgi:hypothetical protein
MALRACRQLMKVVKAGREAADDESNDEIVETFTMADEDEIMTHMMDCLALLAAAQSKMQQDVRLSRNKVFMAALSAVGGSLLGIEKNEQPLQTNAAILELYKAFRFPERYPVGNGRESWLPLHWAVVFASSGQHNVTEADVKALYDPMAMLSTHVDKNRYAGFTPAHLLCMSPVTQCSMQLVRLISTQWPSRRMQHSALCMPPVATAHRPWSFYSTCCR